MSTFVSSVIGPNSDVMVGVAAMLGAFMAGVSWAAYRALGWVDRMTEWANTVPVTDVRVCEQASPVEPRAVAL